MSFERLVEIVDESRRRGWAIEGSVSADETEFLETLSSGRKAQRIGEIGFNAGFSSHAFLRANPTAHVTSFDLVEHEYVSMAKEHIDHEFPDRHTLIAGDSRETVPQFARMGENIPFDLIFIDGGHTYDVAIADIRNMRACAGPDTVVVFDDLLPHKHWGPECVRAWNDAIAEGTITQTALYADGLAVDAVGPEASRAWAVGTYR